MVWIFNPASKSSNPYYEWSQTQKPEIFESIELTSTDLWIIHIGHANPKFMNPEASTSYPQRPGSPKGTPSPRQRAPEKEISGASGIASTWSVGLMLLVTWALPIQLGLKSSLESWKSMDKLKNSPNHQPERAVDGCISALNSTSQDRWFSRKRICHVDAFKLLDWKQHLSFALPETFMKNREKKKRMLHLLDEVVSWVSQLGVGTPSSKRIKIICFPLFFRTSLRRDIGYLILGPEIILGGFGGNPSN